ncbi:DNA-binding transcriptional activator of the SARP family [Amycolatopsis tolypomycina]|uniref:DNA-binding transcriptional activator of the SARP family n=1 Tax=Amycolatopsis tolypomycina TaxID=208445 RepID=A0A1H4WAZ5_9PSEU|nr:BTAD domain-containing putative transcriptional regulator [Amycolatopsis tolypomycina]SEC89831.1 DNA-binding transcriptional activator of the SARP family [Amycolatopsis tolypomycina]
MEFRVLGPVQVLGGGRPIGPSGPRQERILAALLLDAGRVVPVSRLVEVVWDGEPPATAVRQVRNLTTALRRTLVAAGAGEDVLTAEGPGFVLRPAGFDLHAFEDLAARGEYRAALACWRGPALAGVDSAALRPDAERLAERRLAVLEQCLAAEVDAGDDGTVAELTALVAAHPLREGLVGLLMRALHRAGRQADAIDAYQRAKRRLADELGITPGAPLRASYAQLLHEEPAPGRCFLPYDVPDFTGRAADVAVALDALRAGRPVVVDGMAGVGKTAFAVRVAHRAAADFPDGQLFVDLHGHTPGRDPLPPEAALSALLMQTGVPASRQPDGLDERAALWRSRVAGRRLLVVLDNARSASQVVPLLPGGTGVAVLVTGRRRLAAVDGALGLCLDVLPPPEAEALFAAAAGGRAGAGVARLCGFLPLALRIAAARLQARPLWTVDDLVARLGSERRRLGELRAGDRDVAAAFALSYRDLTPPQRRMFRVLGCHPGGDFAAAAAAALYGTDVTEAERLLEDLLDAHLLRQPAPHRYGFHDLIAEHARAEADAGEAATALGRLLDHYRDGEFSFVAERANLVAVTALNGHDEHAWRIADRAVAALREQGHRDELTALARAGARAADRLGDPHARQLGLANLTTAHWETGRLAEAVETSTARLRLVRESGDRAAEAAALARLGAVHGMLGRYADAVRRYRQALVLAAETGSHEVACLAWGNLSNAQEMLGRYEEALTSAAHARAIREEIGDARGAILASAQLGLVLARLGRLPEARSTVSTAVGAAVEADYAFGEAWSRIDLAEVLLADGCARQARAEAERACAILGRLHHPLLLTMAANSSAATAQAMGDPAAAAAAYRLALTTARRIGYRAQEARALLGLGVAEAALGRDAECHLREGRALFAEMGLTAAALS